MPVPELMTWVPSRRRWTRMHRGQRYWVSCRQLGTPETKEASISAANTWWRKKQAEVDGAEPTRQLGPAEELFSALLAVPPDVYAHPEFGGTEEETKTLMQESFGLLVQRLILDPEETRWRMDNILPPARLQQIRDSVAGLRGEPTAATDRTVETHAEAWLRSQQIRVDAGQMTAGRCANNRTCLGQFKTFIGARADVVSIDEGKFEAFHRHCLMEIAARRANAEDGWSVAYARDVFSVTRAFICWLVACRTIEPLRNLESRTFRFGSPAKAVHTWKDSEFKTAVELATGKLRLALLLMANTGATQQDISDLKDSEVDWDAGRIIRKRSKTAGCDNVPVVCYKLWPLTFELLKQYRSGTDRVLLTDQGEPYVRVRLREDGKQSKADGFASSYVHLKKKLQKRLPEFNRPLKQLRKLGASILASHTDHGRFQSYFLGHSPRTVADRLYTLPPQQLFDKAVWWIGYILGQIDPSEV